MAGTSGAARSHELYAWSFPAGGGSVVGVSTRWHGPVVRRLSPGRYTIQIKAQGDMPFQLYGPGINRLTGATQATVYETWVVRLRAGTYVYRARGSSAAASASVGLRIRGTIVVR